MSGRPIKRTLRARPKPGFPFWSSRSAPLYIQRPSAWAGCVRGPFFRLPTPSAGFTLRSHVPEAPESARHAVSPAPARNKQMLHPTALQS